MNTKKQNVVKKISEYYSESVKSGILVCKINNLNAKELAAFKRKMWDVSDTVFVKNTLFYYGVNPSAENKDKIRNQMTGSHLAIFSQKEKDEDIFQVIKRVKYTIRAFSLSKKISPFYVLLDDKCYSSLALEILQSFGSKQELWVGICMMMKVIQIKLCKILELVAVMKQKD